MRYALILLFLAGCATPEQRADQMIAMYGPVCDRLGFQRNTDGWRNCIVQQSAGDDANDAAYGSAIVTKPRR